MTLSIFCDGLCDPNPNGHGCYGWVAYDERETRVAQGYGFLGEGTGMTNNRAEYGAVIASLQWAWKERCRKVKVYTDSQLVVRQVTGKYQIRTVALKALCEEAKALLGQVGGKIEWIPREQNTEADALSRRAHHLVKRGHWTAPTDAIIKPCQNVAILAA